MRPARAEGFRGGAAGAEFAEAEGIGALGEAAALGVEHQFTVEKGGRLEAEGFVKEKLAGGGTEEILAADNLGDAHGGVVHDDGKLVGGEGVMAPDDEIAE